MNKFRGNSPAGPKVGQGEIGMESVPVHKALNKKEGYKSWKKYNKVYWCMINVMNFFPAIEFFQKFLS